MDLSMGFERFLKWDRWANGEALLSLEAMDAPPQKGVLALSHILGCEVGWLDRMGVSVPVDDNDWPGGDLADVRAAHEGVVPDAWAAFLADAELSRPERTFSYQTSTGQRWEHSVSDALLHVMVHSTYHRGQVATHVRAAGGEPAMTGFIHAARTGVV